MSDRARWRAWAERCEHTLEQVLPAARSSPARLHGAMRHATLGGGKRMRPLLVYATGTAFGAPEPALDVPAAAVELIHAYSLVHDDLPAMDDDQLRRGLPTVHVAFDEATAILAGDALQALAFELLGESRAAPAIQVDMLRTLARASGVRGMVGGQALDLDAVGQHLDLDGLRHMHAAKTGALIRAAVRLGALVAEVDKAAMALLDDYADALGLAFQIRDDILDVEGDAAVIGKTAGKDAANDKPTYPSLLGMEASRELLLKLDARMQGALGRLHADTSELASLAHFAVARSH
ncbi:MAG: polyprenyl synthetase family protein [Chiayiivirga sp.]|jgi:farnesyl diphosphate synthase|uniref:polyprenyl synthetase family protein n=1 Tax=Chiayiivirga sp. TaxID=2041042 RepID=UPI0025BF450F|nr:farnesyl diphosphate synthase [Chiayiivirga sp.]MCI1710103.1 polyprenyl synthetase family protein [Chiayiivirga sp.]MCI1729098.1 polyprenyl synthetase family protein [Chiayiivirga sp.]